MKLVAEAKTKFLSRNYVLGEGELFFIERKIRSSIAIEFFLFFPSLIEKKIVHRWFS